MRSIVIDEISSQDIEKLNRHLAESLEPSGLSGVYWLHLPPDILSPDQHQHATSCGPHQAALVVEEDSLRLELLVRSKQNISCACTAFATKSQRDFLLRYLDGLIEELDIRT